MSLTTEQEIETLLRGEIAAAETYKQALDQVDHPEADTLRQVQQQHGQAIRFFYEQLVARGEYPAKTSGVWGFFARAVEGGARLFGDKAALAALREGERQGLDLYERALESGLLPPACRTFIEQGLIPEQRRHIDILSRLIESA